MLERPNTTLLRRLALESGDQEDVPQTEVASSTVDVLLPLLERGLAGEAMVRIAPTDYWFRVTEVLPDTAGEYLRAEFGAAAAGESAIVEMTLRPPQSEGEPAILMTSVGGWLDAVNAGALGDRAAADRVALEISDLEKCIAWTWLEMRGYATRLRNLGSPLEVLFAAGGGMLTAIVNEPGQDPEVCFLALNEPDAVRRLPPTPSVSVRARLFHIDGVYLVPLVALVGDTWYESWINACSDDGRGIEELEVLAAQDRIVFLVYDGTSFDPERTVQIPNPLAEPLARMRRVLQDVPPWTMEAFADAREQLYAAYPTPQDLIEGPDISGR